MTLARQSYPIVFLTLLAGFPAFAHLPESDDWNLVKDEDDIQIFTQQVRDSSFDAFRAVTVLDAPLSNVMAVMADPRSCVDWVHGCAHSEGLEQKSFNDRSAYSVNDLPWPAQDRDYVLRIRTHTKARASVEGQTPPVIVMELRATPDQHQGTGGKVRVEHSDTLYEFYDYGNGKTHMTWIQHTEPNGALPSWLVNSLAIDIPFNSLKRLEALANSTAYRRQDLVFDAQGQLVDVRGSRDPDQAAVPDNGLGHQ